MTIVPAAFSNTIPSIPFEFEIAKIKLPDGNSFKPWNGKQPLGNWEWKRDDKVFTEQTIRLVPSATFQHIEKDVPVYSPTEPGKIITTYDVAHFQDDNNPMKTFDISKRLLPDDMSIGDHVELYVAGCCSILLAKEPETGFKAYDIKNSFTVEIGVTMHNLWGKTVSDYEKDKSKRGISRKDVNKRRKSKQSKSRTKSRKSTRKQHQ